ncbi:hypothetical protein AMECASPLE_008797 [Ameca splendens]|uniref:Uncharacterized protein n=1 Tax=Ameca splendens TaxID=208324 RepID=A0ABV0Z9T0_9TELE
MCSWSREGERARMASASSRHILTVAVAPGSFLIEKVGSLLAQIELLLSSLPLRLQLHLPLYPHHMFFKIPTNDSVIVA